jgi:hypothetical protein
MIGIKLTQEEKESINGQEFAPNSHYHAIQDVNDDWFITELQVMQTIEDEFLWVKDIDLIEFEPKLIDLPNRTHKVKYLIQEMRYFIWMLEWRKEYFRHKKTVLFQGNSLNNELFDKEFIDLQYNEIHNLNYKHKDIDHSKLIVLEPMTFRSKRDFNTHRLLRAIANNTLLSKLLKNEQTIENEKFNGL